MSFLACTYCGAVCYGMASHVSVQVCSVSLRSIAVCASVYIHMYVRSRIMFVCMYVCTYIHICVRIYSAVVYITPFFIVALHEYRVVLGMRLIAPLKAAQGEVWSSQVRFNIHIDAIGCRCVCMYIHTYMYRKQKYSVFQAFNNAIFIISEETRTAGLPFNDASSRPTALPREGKNSHV